MAKGVSLHIGLNSVDPKQYGGWDGKLTACEADAHAMHKLAQASGLVQSSVLLTKQATSIAVLSAIGRIAQQLVAGDLFFLTYSGHGGQIDDVTGDEPDGINETWVLYDRQLLDDELYSMWGKFASGVRIIVLSDSCHSGTVTRNLKDSLLHAPQKSASGAAVPREIPREIADQDAAARAALYQSIQWTTKKGPDDIKATVLLISGCQDNQLSLDGEQNGLFTATLLQVWNNGQFHGSYVDLHHQIVSRMPASQKPNFFRVGATNQAFERQQPFNPNLTIS